LAPTSPSDVVFYKQWKEFAASRGLPVKFEAGLKDNVPFQTLLKSAYAIVTTSVAEGFGLAFLEPWIARRSLVGRDLPEMTQGFKREGMDLSTLYPRLQVPLSWVGFEALRRKIESGLSNMMNAYGRAPRPADVDSAIHAATDGDRVDFGRLDEDLQEQVIRRLLDTPSLVSELKPSSLLPEGPPGRAIEMNRRIVQREYNSEQYGRRLMDIYRSLLDSAVVPAGALRTETLLDKFLAPERFYLIRS
jgi:glycosyltransferase involved in cell wall biosynthesis